jgi:hypothetical protein
VSYLEEKAGIGFETGLVMRRELELLVLDLVVQNAVWVKRLSEVAFALAPSIWLLEGPPPNDLITRVKFARNICGPRSTGLPGRRADEALATANGHRKRVARLSP